MVLSNTMINTQEVLSNTMINTEGECPEVWISKISAWYYQALAAKFWQGYPLNHSDNVHQQFMASDLFQRMEKYHSPISQRLSIRISPRLWRMSPSPTAGRLFSNAKWTTSETTRSVLNRGFHHIAACQFYLFHKQMKPFEIWNRLSYCWHVRCKKLSVS